jgi:hypothetical protein
LNLRDREDALFDEWRTNRGRFVKDGAGCRFEQQRARILFILKEVNDTDDGDWDLRKIIDYGNVAATWNNIARWTAHILDGAVFEQVRTIDQETRANYTSRIAAMNLKKAAGGRYCCKKNFRILARNIDSRIRCVAQD